MNEIRSKENSVLASTFTGIMGSRRPGKVKQNPNPHASTQRRSKVKQKLKETKIKLAGTALNNPLSETQMNTLNVYFSNLHTPDHPPYAEMIERAILELNNDEGSSEESISNFIRKEYDDLPLFHITMLKHHLGKLCDQGSIILTKCKNYLLAATYSTLPIGMGRNSRMKQDPKQWIKMQKRRKVDVEEQIDESNDLTELVDQDMPPPGFENVILVEKCNLEEYSAKEKNKVTVMENLQLN